MRRKHLRPKVVFHETTKSSVNKMKMRAKPIKMKSCFLLDVLMRMLDDDDDDLLLCIIIINFNSINMVVTQNVDIICSIIKMNSLDLKHFFVTVEYHVSKSNVDFL